MKKAVYSKGDLGHMRVGEDAGEKYLGLGEGTITDLIRKFGVAGVEITREDGRVMSYIFDRRGMISLGSTRLKDLESNRPSLLEKLMPYGLPKFLGARQ